MWALCTLYSAGVSHNDLHPGNIVVDREGDIRIIDFSHAAIHVCAGEDSCPELLFAKENLHLL
jgi:RIO-like serine/threonine protein kinase